MRSKAVFIAVFSDGKYSGIVRTRDRFIGCPASDIPNTLGIPNSDPAASVPVGVLTHNQSLFGRNTYYWRWTANATSGGNYAKAQILHGLHTADAFSKNRAFVS